MSRLAIKTAQQAFISCLITEMGGPSKAAKKLGCRVQDIINWRARGSVAKPFVFKVWNEAWTVLMGPLNWKLYCKHTHPEDRTSWEESIKRCRLSPDHEKFILSFPAPKV